LAILEPVTCVSGHRHHDSGGVPEDHEETATTTLTIRVPDARLPAGDSWQDTEMLATVAIGYVPPLQPDGAVSDRPPEKVHFMRFKNSYAAAVAAAVSAVVFSAAFQPAEAGFVTIDNFSNSATNTASASGTSTGLILLNVSQPITTVFEDRAVTQAYAQSGGSGRTAAVFSGTAVVTGGIGTFTVSKAALPSGSSYNNLRLDSTVTWVNADSSPVDLLGDGVGGFNDRMKFVIPSWTQSGSGTYPNNYAFFYVFDVNDNAASLDWTGGAPIGTTEVPFSSFVLSQPTFDWGAVKSVMYDSSVSPPTGGASGALTNAIQFDSIQAVPEPTQMVSVAAVGAMYGAWRLRKLRRSREAAGDAIAG
jgi:hypothetical protein